MSKIICKKKDLKRVVQCLSFDTIDMFYNILCKKKVQDVFYHKKKQYLCSQIGENGKFRGDAK